MEIVEILMERFAKYGIKPDHKMTLYEAISKCLDIADKLKKENEELKELLFKANTQLKFIGCFAGCDNGVMRDSNGNPCRCQCCDEQEQIAKAVEK